MSIATRIGYIKKKISDTLNATNRPLDAVTLMAVTKGRSLETISQAMDAGLLHFGESYWQEAQKKISYFQNRPVIWHFIGKIQKNKAAAIANAVDWVHSLDSQEVAALLSQHRSPDLPPLNVCIQVNLQQETNKSGVEPSSLLSFAQDILKMPHLSLKGLMIIPRYTDNETEQYAVFLALAQLQKALSESLGKPLDTLSMGMSNDFNAAIRAGSTIIRIGRSIFNEEFT